MSTNPLLANPSTQYSTNEPSSEDDGLKAKVLRTYRKHETRIKYCSAIFGALISMISLSLASVAYHQVAGFVGDYDSIVNSWKAVPLMEVAFVPSSATPSACPINFTQVVAYWPGTYDACQCTTNAASSNNRACHDTEIDKGCSTRYGLAGVSMDVYPNVTVCIRRAGPTALERNGSASSGCPQGTRICGEGAAQICFPTSESLCPITDVGFLPMNLSLNETGADGSTEAYTLDNVTYYFYWKRGGTLDPILFNMNETSPDSLPVTGLPLVDLLFQPDDPCTLTGCGYGDRKAEYDNMEDAYKSASNNGYKLRDWPCDGGCEKPDTTSISPDGRDLRFMRLFNRTENELFSFYPQIPPQYVTSNLGYIYYFSVRSEVIWYDSCPTSRQEVADKQRDVDAIKAAQLWLLVLSCLSFFILSLYYGIGAIIVSRPCCERRHRLLWLWNKTSPYEKGCKYFFKIGSLACVITSMVIALITLWFWNEINNYNNSNSNSNSNLMTLTTMVSRSMLGLDATIYNSCSDTLTDETFSFIGDTFNSLSYNNIWNTVGWSLTGAFDTIIDCLR